MSSISHEISEEVFSFLLERGEEWIQMWNNNLLGIQMNFSTNIQFSSLLCILFMRLTEQLILSREDTTETYEKQKAEIG